MLVSVYLPGIEHKHNIGLQYGTLYLHFGGMIRHVVPVDLV